MELTKEQEKKLDAWVRTLSKNRQDDIVINISMARDKEGRAKVTDEIMDWKNPEGISLRQVLGLKPKKLTVKVDGIETALDELREEDIERIDKGDIDIALMGLVAELPKKQKLGINRTLIRYRNSALTLEEAVKKEFENL